MVWVWPPHTSMNLKRRVARQVRDVAHERLGGDRVAVLVDEAHRPPYLGAGRVTAPPALGAVKKASTSS